MSVQKKPAPSPSHALRRSLSRTLSDAGSARRSSTDAPALRLVGTEPLDKPQPITGADAKRVGRVGRAGQNTDLKPSDPRWVLAMRAGNALQGTVLTPDRRRGLMRLALVMGLTPFDASLILAIVQDQARRGYPPEHCASAGADQLVMIPAPTSRPGEKRRRLWTIAGLTVCLIGLQLFTVWWLLSGR